jgi:hypothetical protein
MWLPNKCKTKTAGFSLVETLIVLTIFSFIGVAALKFFANKQLYDTISAAEVTTQKRIDVLLNKIRRDFTFRDRGPAGDQLGYVLNAAKVGIIIKRKNGTTSYQVRYETICRSVPSDLIDLLKLEYSDPPLTEGTLANGHCLVAVNCGIGTYPVIKVFSTLTKKTYFWPSTNEPKKYGRLKPLSMCLLINDTDTALNGKIKFIMDAAVFDERFENNFHVVAKELNIASSNAAGIELLDPN